MRGGICRCRYCTERVQIRCAFCQKSAWVLRKKVEQRAQRFCSRRCANFWNARVRAGRPFCACGCGKPIGPQATRFSAGHNRPQHEPVRGPAHPRWTGGPKRVHLTPEYREWRDAVFHRDNYTCQNCGARSAAGNPVYLHAHHMKPVAEEPLAAFDLDNGRTLCIECHRTHHWGADRKRTTKAADTAAD